MSLPPPPSHFSTVAPTSTVAPLQVLWGVIGCGSVCEVKSLPALYKTPRSSVVALCRRDREKLADFQERHGLREAELFEEAEDLVKHMSDLAASTSPLSVCAVYIATPVSTHVPLTELCLSFSNLAVYCEKPLSRSSLESLPLLSLSSSFPPVFAAYYRRCLPKFQAIKAALPSLGAISSVQVTLLQRRHLSPPASKTGWRYDKQESGGGLLLDLGSHIIDLLDYLLGPITRASGCAVRVNGDSPGGEDVEDSVTGSWLHTLGGSRVPAAATFNFAASRDFDEVCIIGAAAALRFSAFTDLPAMVASGSAAVWAAEVPVEFESFGGVQEHVHGPLVKKIVDRLLDGGREGGEDCCVCTAEIAHRTQVVMDALLNGREGHEADYLREVRSEKGGGREEGGGTRDIGC